MDFLEILNSIIAFLQTNLTIAIVAAAVLLYLLYRSSKLLFTILFIVLLLAGLFYLITDLSSTGLHQKKKMIRKYDLP